MNVDLWHLFRDLFVICFAWIVFGSAFYEWGNLISRKLKLNLIGVNAFFSKIWLGWIFCILFFSVVHLFVPINWISSFFFYIPASTVFFIKNTASFNLFFKTINKKVLIPIILLILIVSLFSMAKCSRSDSCMYHLNTIRWQNEYSIVPGLGNIHTRLGFNQSYFVYCASISFYPFFKDYGRNIATAFLWLVLCIELMLSRKGTDLVLLGFLHLLPFSYYWISSPNPDIASIILQIILFRYMLEAGEARTGSENKDSVYYSNIVMAALIGAVLITVKLSNAIWVLGFGILAIALKSGRSLDSIAKLQIRKASIFVVLLLGVWIARGYMQTGYPFFPSTLLGISADWAVDKGTAELAEKSVYAFSRIIDYELDSEALKDFKWFPYWFEVYVNPFYQNYCKENINPKFMQARLLTLICPNIFQKSGYCLAVCLVMSLIVLIFYFAKITTSILSKSKCLLSMLGVTFIAIIFWFFSAPDPRFANALFLIMLSISFKLLKIKYSSLKITDKYRNMIILIPFLTFIPAYVGVLDSGAYDLTGLKTSVADELPSKTTDSGLEVTLIYENKWPFDAYLISTYANEFNPRLKMRGKTYQEGFTVK